MKIDIRLAVRADAELIADLSRQTFRDTFAAQNTKEDMDKFLNEQFTKRALMREVEDGESVFLIASVDHEIAGYARLRPRSRPEFEDQLSLEIARIYAVNKMIGKGVGSALMQECIRIAKEKNQQLLWLGVWKENKTAIEFYKRWGFEIFAEADFLLGNDLQRDWLMKRIV